jgi:hypothetical protein
MWPWRLASPGECYARTEMGSVKSSRDLSARTQTPVSATDFLLDGRKEARCRDHADHRLFGHFRGAPRCSGDGGQLPGDLSRVLTLHHRADVGRPAVILPRGSNVRCYPLAPAGVDVALPASRLLARAMSVASTRSRPCRASFTAERIWETMVLYPGPLVTYPFRP